MKALTQLAWLALWLVGLALPAHADIHVAASVSRDAVSNAVALASSGDTVIIPAGSATWTSGIIITNKSIRLAGMGTNLTFITDNIPKVSPEIPLIKYYASSNAFICELAGIHFSSGTVTQEMTRGRLQFIGDSKLLRVHHNVYTNAWGVIFAADGFLHGVFDHNRTVTMDHTHPLILGHDVWQPYNGATNSAGTAYNYGHGSWADDAYWGSDKYIFWESNVDEDRTSPVNANGIDIFEGGRLTHRFNVKTNALITNHGTEGQGRGHKQTEDYGNTYVGTSAIGSLAQIRGGGFLTFSNTFVNINQGYNLRVYRPMFWRDGGWNWAGGTNVYDDNVQHPVNGYWERGTHDGGMDNNGIVDSTKIWATAPEQWLGTNLMFVVRNLTKYNALGVDEQPHSYVTGNGQSTISYSSADFPNLRFDTGDIYEVWAISHSLDQAGQGKDNGLMTGLPGTPAMWPTNATETCYMWAQTLGFRSDQTCHTEGRDWTNNTAKPGYTPFAYPHYLVQGPGTPNTPSPADGAVGVDPTSVTLSWSVTNSFFHDIYFGTVSPPVTMVGSQDPLQTFFIGPLTPATTYHWRVVAYNFDSLTTNTWSFTTSASTPSAVPVANPRRRLFR